MTFWRNAALDDNFRARLERVRQNAAVNNGNDFPRVILVLKLEGKFPALVAQAVFANRAEKPGLGQLVRLRGPGFADIEKIDAVFGKPRIYQLADTAR